MEPVNNDVLSGVKQGLSFKDSLLGKNIPLAGTDVDDGFISDDDELKKEDDEDCPTIYLSKVEKSRIRRPWRRSLIIKVMRRSIGYNYLLNRIRTLWKPKAGMELVALENDYFQVRFASLVDYDHAKYEGPWMVMDHYLIVKEWSPNFDPMIDVEEKLLVWVRFPCLPIEYFDYDFLMKVGEKIGRPVCVDEATSLVSRGKFARMCVEIDITKPLLAKFRVRRRIRKIEYEGIHLVCFHCGVYGHRKEICPSFLLENNQGSNSANRELNVEQANVGTVAVDSMRDVTINLEILEPYGKVGEGSFAVLQSLDQPLESNEDPVLGGDEVSSLENTTTNKQQLGSRGRRANVQISEKEVWNAKSANKVNAPPLSAGTLHHARSMSSGRPNQVAAETEHVVVRGSKQGHNISREVVVTNSVPEGLGISGLLNENSEHHGDPPDDNLMEEDHVQILNCDSGGNEGLRTGPASREFARVMKDMLRRYKPVLVGLLEPKISGSHADEICCNFGFDQWLRVEAVGYSGGIWILWKDEIDVEIISTHPQFCCLKNVAA
ncbi:hypothetical protein PTKIN_Ptkin06aG0180000 [Pterospermum kingtungense]